MLTQEQAVEIRILERQGRSIRQIMRETGLSRNTVRKYLRGGKAEYGPREPRPCKLDPFKAYLLERIEQARPDWIPATVLMREIGARGYTGGISQLKAYVQAFKVSRVDPVVRFETAPGQQMQADFTTIRRGRDRLLAFVATLGYSRATFVRFTHSEQFVDWRDGLNSLWLTRLADHLENERYSRCVAQNYSAAVRRFLAHLERRRLVVESVQ
ncbi:MAG TPA: IS21 family transposase, partial [Steroidobacter sp.]|uniref:IS21 family transposase n=1 Tax=Steroidobacter sp. TaxID=1978227 RepID=UPI002ED92C46